MKEYQVFAVSEDEMETLKNSPFLQIVDDGRQGSVFQPTIKSYLSEAQLNSLYSFTHFDLKRFTLIAQVKHSLTDEERQCLNQRLAHFYAGLVRQSLVFDCEYREEIYAILKTAGVIVVAEPALYLQSPYV